MEMKADKQGRRIVVNTLGSSAGRVDSFTPSTVVAYNYPSGPRPGLDRQWADRKFNSRCNGQLISQIRLRRDERSSLCLPIRTWPIEASSE